MLGLLPFFSFLLLIVLFEEWYNNKNDPNFKAKSILIIKVKFIKLLKILGNVFSFSEINEPVN